jgi:hypothetical protein
MFKRPKDDAEDAGDVRPPIADTPTPAPVGPQPDPTPPLTSGSQEVDIHTLLRRLDDVARAAGDAGGTALRRASEDVDEHAEVLSATVTARQEAQRLLALATQERDRASADGAAIIEESRHIAARLTHEAQTHAAEAMAEIQRWATGQREQVGEVVSELTTAAQREAETIRERAHGDAVAEAQRAAQVYVARAAAIATRDAERFRSEAADVLGRSAEVVAAAHATMHEFTQSLSGFVSTMGEHLDALQSVVDQAAQGQGEPTELAPISVDPASWAREGLDDVDEADLVELPLDPYAMTAPAVAEAGDGPDEGSDDVAEVEDPEVDDVEDPEVGTDEPDDEPADADAESESTEPASRYDAAAGFPADEERASAPNGSTRRVPPPPGGRPLGSLFRDADPS